MRKPAQYPANISAGEDFVMLGNMRIMKPKLRRAGDVAGEAAQAQAHQPSARFEVKPSQSRKKPWMVEDHAAPKLEDPRLYHFSSKRKAEQFKAELEREATAQATHAPANDPSPSL